jgi:hypothetical protein
MANVSKVLTRKGIHVQDLLHERVGAIRQRARRCSGVCERGSLRRSCSWGLRDFGQVGLPVTEDGEGRKPLPFFMPYGGPEGAVRGPCLRTSLRYETVTQTVIEM